jgi:hypothetical protein
MNKSYYFYGVVEGEMPEDTWKVLHDHFERLASENDVRVETTFTNRRAARKAVEQDGL